MALVVHSMTRGEQALGEHLAAVDASPWHRERVAFKLSVAEAAQIQRGQPGSDRLVCPRVLDVVHLSVPLLEGFLRRCSRASVPIAPGSPSMSPREWARARPSQRRRAYARSSDRAPEG